jgi:ABC-type transport system involved in multi-copper enzyme maturation permease subunit
MPVMPVITRELRSSARQPFTFYLRSLGACGLVLTAAVFGLEHGLGPQLGGRLFTNLHLTLLLGTWILVPLLTADSISRERREGTLGLLFLTRLTSSDVVIAKSLANGLRALTLWIAVLPVLMIPLLLGGVSWIQALVSILIHFNCLCAALTAGLLGSAWSKTWVRSLINAAFIAGFFVLSMGLLAGTLFHSTMAPAGATRWDSSLIYGFVLLSNVSTVWLVRILTSGQVLWIMIWFTLCCLLGCVIAIAAAGAKVRRSWQEEPPSARQLWWEKQFCTPVIWVSFFRRWMRRKLERNPIGWLEQRSWTGRLVTWSWFAIIISIYSAVLTDASFWRNNDDIQRLIGWLLAGSLALSAAGSFRRERESGVLELLLVSPMGASQIITGRLGGLWGQFLPAFGLLLGVWIYFSNLFHQSDFPAIGFYAITFVTLPVIGLYHSLRCRTLLGAFLMTILVGLVAPLLITAVTLKSFILAPGLQVRLSPGASLVQIVLAALSWFKLQDRMKRRAFSLDRSPM